MLSPSHHKPDLARTHRQVQHLAALARLHIQRSAYQQAAAVYEVLAKRRGGSLPEEVVSLDERLEYFQSAVLQVSPTHIWDFTFSQ